MVTLKIILIVIYCEKYAKDLREIRENIIKMVVHPPEPGNTWTPLVPTQVAAEEVAVAAAVLVVEARAEEVHL